ncbi:hypothetical protein BC941DRAFT_473521 [Chlamydoabsidia padenii]|nr:hypothetical protein BC941DRAFT_473521 [Chlamydoabsidia padenii]
MVKSLKKIHFTRLQNKLNVTPKDKPWYELDKDIVLANAHDKAERLTKERLAEAENPDPLVKYVQNVVRMQYQEQTRKVTLDQFLRLTGDEKVVLQDDTTELVAYIRNMAIKTQMFINFYILKQLEYDNPLNGISASDLLLILALNHHFSYVL